ncbi:MAG: hypothetical protein COA79_16205 [Planctomycetota bacterium]|nr:MAG: hypothetical protein COA79_16205 [Planctomycetota bacterium]
MDILIVDDDKSITDVLFDYLNIDYSLNIFNDPIRALECYKSNLNFDAIITDFYMPILYGDGLISRILALNPLQSFIIISGLITDKQKDILHEFKASIQVIHKPFKLKDITLALEEIKNKSNI